MKTLDKGLAALQTQEVIEQLKEMSDSSLQVCHNNYCSSLGYEDELFDNDEYNINEHFNTPFDVLLALELYNLNDDYFYFHNGNLISFNYLTGDDSPITLSELAEWLINEDKLAEYDVTVTTIDDILASIEDNISEDISVLYRMCDCLTIEYNDSIDSEDLIKGCMSEVSSYNYNKLKGLLEYLDINYK